MLLSIIAVLGLFALARFFLVRSTPNVALANGLAGAIVFAFVLGLFSARLFGIGAGPALAPSAGPPAAVSSAAAAAPARIEGRDVTRACKTLRVGAAGAAGNLDEVKRDGTDVQFADGGSLDARATYTLSGWAAAPAADRTASAVCLAVDGTIEPGVRAYYFAPRPDVAATYHRPSLTDSGYTIIVPAGLLKPGPHRLQIAVELPDGRVRALPGARTVTVR